jgi:hypothetical protein
MSSCCTTGHQWQVMSALRSLTTLAQGLIHPPKFPGRGAWTDGHEKTTGTFYDVCIRQPGTTSQQCRTVCLTSSLRWRYPAHASHGRATKPVRACDPLHTRPDGGHERWSPACGNRRAVTAGLLDCPIRSIVDGGRARRQSPHAHAKVLWDPAPAARRHLTEPAPEHERRCTIIHPSVGALSAAHRSTSHPSSACPDQIHSESMSSLRLLHRSGRSQRIPRWMAFF